MCCYQNNPELDIENKLKTHDNYLHKKAKQQTIRQINWVEKQSLASQNVCVQGTQDITQSSTIHLSYLIDDYVKYVCTIVFKFSLRSKFCVECNQCKQCYGQF